MKYYLGLGSNLGDREDFLRQAVALLKQRPDVTVAAVSSIYESPAWGPVPQGPFLNMACLTLSELAPDAMLDVCLSVEQALGRVRRVRWGPRTIDIDILYANSLVVTTPRLTIPHPGAAQRDFVLAPLAELAPDLVDPNSGRTVAELLQALGTTQIRRWSTF